MWRSGNTFSGMHSNRSNNTARCSRRALWAVLYTRSSWRIKKSWLKLSSCFCSCHLRNTNRFICSHRLCNKLSHNAEVWLTWPQGALTSLTHSWVSKFWTHHDTTGHHPQTLAGRSSCRLSLQCSCTLLSQVRHSHDFLSGSDPLDDSPLLDRGDQVLVKFKKNKYVNKKG